MNSEYGFALRQVSEHEIMQQLNLIQQAKATLKERNIPQWQEGVYPGLEDLNQDYKLAQSYGFFLGEVLVATAAVSQIPDSLYDDNRFFKNDKYCIIHRVAVRSNMAGQGVGVMFLKAIIACFATMGVVDFRIDTHPQNFAMQKTIIRAGFHEVGELVLPDISDPERIVYQATKALN